ncbi:MAG: hypothetical protein HY231_05725 [Acidobacteria bacterium]|nr:hypothetical protein [Acidobacteriota bacterium]
MMRRLLQLILLVALSSGATAQAWGCGMMHEDAHACCRALATIRANAKSHTVKKTQTAKLSSDACGCSSSPASHRETPVGNTYAPEHQLASSQGKVTCGRLALSALPPRPVRRLSPHQVAPPHFILYGSLLI